LQLTDDFVRLSSSKDRSMKNPKLRTAGRRFLPSLPTVAAGPLNFFRIVIVMMSWLAAGALASAASTPNPGDPLYCQPNEGVAYLIVNGGAGVFTVDPDCYNLNINNDTTTTIATGQGGTLTLTLTATAGNYVYTPPTPGFTGLDTFSIAVTTVWNGAGGTGSAGGTSRPGGPATLNITLNVLPASTTLMAPGVATLVPVPAGSLSGCTVGGNPGLGPTASAVYGCVNGIIAGLVSPAHGALTTSGNTLKYTPTSGYSGMDTFTYEAYGVNTDGSNALESGEITVQVTVTAAPPSTPAPPTVTLMFLGMLSLAIFHILRGRSNRTQDADPSGSGSA
jgi:hypothetical protein